MNNFSVGRMYEFSNLQTRYYIILHCDKSDYSIGTHDTSDYIISRRYRKIYIYILYYIKNNYM